MAPLVGDMISTTPFSERLSLKIGVLPAEPPEVFVRDAETDA